MPEPDKASNGTALIRGLSQVWPILLVAVAWGGALVRMELLAEDVKDNRVLMRSHMATPLHTGSAIEITRLADAVRRIEAALDKLDDEMRDRRIRKAAEGAQKK